MKRLLLLTLIVLSIAGFSTAAQDEPLTVIATTTILADVAQNVGGERVVVSALVPADADAHAFEPAPQDVQRVAEADIVLAVGAGYEAFLGGLMENAASVPLVIASNGISMYPFSGEHGHEEEPADAEHEAAEPLGILGEEGVCEDDHAEEHSDDPAATPEADHAEDEHEHGACDPHVWTDPANIAIWTDSIAAAFAERDAANADFYRANAEAYKAQIETVRAEMEEILSAVPEERRVLITNHEFMSYFARAFGFEVVGVVIPGGTTAAALDPQSLAELVEVVREKGVPAIFAEASANPDLINTVAQEAGVQVVTALSESLTAADGVAPTVLDYLRYNAQTVAAALG
ncbi:MAG: zinc ABC transporter substrate-binding protein [Anaerolineae bacterium]|nr:zinc ABC transporter substrate-binding protein [Anaerolineae bacterium]